MRVSEREKTWEYWLDYLAWIKAARFPSVAAIKRELKRRGKLNGG